MDLKDVFTRLRNAKSAHLGWVNRAQSLIEGKPVNQEKIPVMPTDCIFGKWYYTDGRKLSRLKSYIDIEEPHNQLHKIYEEIFHLLFDNKKGSFISRLTGSHKREQAKRSDEARQRFQDLQHMSTIIVGRLDKLEKDLHNLTPEQHEQVFGP